jgi:hypothetical protein
MTNNRSASQHRIISQTIYDVDSEVVPLIWKSVKIQDERGDIDDLLASN